MQELHHVEIITIHDFYDHPISGLCKYDKEWYWYDWENYDKYVQYQDGEILYEGMRYMAHEILNYQLAYELYWHALFCTNVKTETTFSHWLV